MSIDKVFIIGAIAAFLIGPKRLPTYAEKLAQLVRSLRASLDDAKSHAAEQLGPDFAEIDWQKLNPRQYDPREIIKRTLLEGDADGDRVEAPLDQRVVVKPPGAQLASSQPDEDEATVRDTRSRR